MTPDDRIAELEALVAQLYEQLSVLLAENQALRERVAKDSHKRHKPPTSDGLQRGPRSQRHMSARKSANPPTRPLPSGIRKRGRRKQSLARNLLERLWLGQSEVPSFLDDFAIPFDSNQAEQELRMLTVQQKISGCFRSEPGATAYCRIKGYLATLRKRRQALLHALQAAFAGRPLLPALG
jgi:hypothetical protein